MFVFTFWVSQPVTSPTVLLGQLQDKNIFGEKTCNMYMYNGNMKTNTFGSADKDWTRIDSPCYPIGMQQGFEFDAHC